MSSLIKAFDDELRKRLQGFSKIINTPPKQDDVKENPFANKSKYLPISFVEMKLDEVFFGLWQTKNFKSKVVVNEIIGDIDLLVYHPVVKEWISRTGSASTPIQMQKGSGITEVSKKIHNTLVKDYPHLKAECIKNAAKSFGKIFGRDLNRMFEDQYVPLLTMPEDDLSTIGQITLIESLLGSTTIQDGEQNTIFREMNSYTFNQAAKCIDYLQSNQLDAIESGRNYKASDIDKKIQEKVNDVNS